MQGQISGVSQSYCLERQELEAHVVVLISFVIEIRNVIAAILSC